LAGIGGEFQGRAPTLAPQWQLEELRILTEQGDNKVRVAPVDRVLDRNRGVVLFDAVFELRPSRICVFPGDDPLRVGQAGRRRGDFLQGEAFEPRMLGAKALQRRVIPFFPIG